MRPPQCYFLPLNRYSTTSVHAGYTSRSEGYAYDGFGRLSGTSSFSGTSTTAGTVNVEDGNPVYINQFTTINGHA